MTSLVRALLTLTALVATAAACATLRGAGPPPEPTDGETVAAEPNARVVRIVDGDTLVADIGGDETPVRLIGIDTPESVIPDSPPECFGVEASAHLESLIPAGTPIRIERDVEARDRFDRLLGYVYRAGDGLFVNLAMVDHGFAETLSIAPNVTHADAFASVAARARSENRGLWSAC